jgi:hypothetical protein
MKLLLSLTFLISVFGLSPIVSLLALNVFVSAQIPITLFSIMVYNVIQLITGYLLMLMANETRKHFE